MSPNLGTLRAAAVMLSRAVCSEPAGSDSAVSDSTERRSDSKCGPVPRAPVISRIETRPIPNVSNLRGRRGSVDWATDGTNAKKIERQNRPEGL